MSGLNPQGVEVCSFKAPSPEELDHDYLWRTNRHLPERGRIGIFNRSHYEEVLVVWPITSGSAGWSPPKAMVEALDGLDLKFPELDARKRKELAAAREALTRGKKPKG